MISLSPIAAYPLTPRGGKKAVGAAAASILIAIHHMLKNGTAYKDLGSDHFDHRAKGKDVLRLLSGSRAWASPYTTLHQPRSHPGGAVELFDEMYPRTQPVKARLVAMEQIALCGLPHTLMVAASDRTGARGDAPKAGKTKSTLSRAAATDQRSGRR